MNRRGFLGAVTKLLGVAAVAPHVPAAIAAAPAAGPVVQYATNATVKWYGECDTLDTTRVDVFDRYEWKEYGVVVRA